TSATSCAASATSPDAAFRRRSRSAPVQTFNAITSRIFDVVLAPFGHRAMWFDLLVWPVLAGVAALLIYKLVSNQRGIADAKRRIMVNLLEVVLYRENVLGVVG